MKFSVLSGIAALAAQASAANLPEIEVVGRKFFYSSNGSQFYIRGVAYQSNSVVNQSSSSFSDPLADIDSCKRDIPYLQQLSTNVVRVYAVNSTEDHSECMQALNDAGIYVLSDLSEPGLSIKSEDPKWDISLFNRYTSVVDAFANYSNVLGFIAGNEVINERNTTQAAPFVKAAIRDVKAYIKQKNYRSIPVGYSASDVADVRVPEADYFACGDNSERADFFATNIYEWCGDSSFQQSGYAARTQEMQNMTIPVFFSEYGCNTVRPRKFDNTKALFSSEMTDVWSGGIVYEYFQEANDYGLVSIDGSSVSTLEDFSYLSAAMQSVSPTSAQRSEASSNATSTMQCPPTDEPQWGAATNLPPTPDSSICDCLSDSASCSLSDDVDEKSYGKLFGYICGEISCDAIQANGTTGEYGAFAGCSPKQQLNYLMNQYYQSNSAASNCDFSGSATLKSNVKTASSCNAYFNQAGASGTGSISRGSSVNVGSSTVGAAATGGSSGSGSAKSSGSKASSSGDDSGSSAKSSSSASKSSKSKNAAPATGNVGVAAGVLGGAMAVVLGAL